MKGSELLPLLPLFVVSVTVFLVLIVIAFRRRHALTAILSGVGLLLAFLTLPVISFLLPRQLTPLFIIDGYAIFSMGLVFTAGFTVILMSYRYLELQESNREEYYILLLLASLGAAVIVASSHFASFFLGLEILSISSYALIAYTYTRNGFLGIEAGVKYLILAAASDAFLIFGMALIYAEVGSLEFYRIAKATGDGGMGLFFAGTGLLIAGLGFKLSLVPFHMWTPDVYQGAPAPVTGFVASVSKGAVFVLMLRYFTIVDIHAHDSLFITLTVIAVASMFTGNLLALMQNHVKRVLAYSSIAHFGYLLIAFLASGSLGMTAAGFYLVAYFVTILGALGVIAVLSGPEGEPDLVGCYRGLAWKRPWLGGVFTAMLLSLAGMPLTAGFLGKFYIMAAGIESTLWLLIICLAVNSVIGLFYYLRIIAAMFRPVLEDEQAWVASSAGTVAANLALAILMVLLVCLGIYPAPLIDIIEMAFTKLT